MFVRYTTCSYFPTNKTHAGSKNLGKNICVVMCSKNTVPKHITHKYFFLDSYSYGTKLKTNNRNSLPSLYHQLKQQHHKQQQQQTNNNLLHIYINGISSTNFAEVSKLF